MRVPTLAVALLCVAAISGAAAIDAVVRLHSATANITGLVTITQIADGSYDFAFNIGGMAPTTTHGVHVHEFGDISSADATAMGGHFNPFSAPHACAGTDPRHVGDLGSFTTDASGNYVGTINSEVRASGQALTLNFDASAHPVFNGNAIGRGLVIHAVADDCTTQPTGASGARLGQGVIGAAFNASGSINTIGSMYGGLMALYAKMYDTAGLEMGRVWIRNATTSATGVEVYAYIWGVAPGSVHGLHLHAFGDHTLLSAANAGGHFNPTGANHGLPYESTSTHMGDLGNVVADNNGVILHHAIYDSPQHLINFQGGVKNIIGRAVVLHNQPDQGLQYTLASIAAGGNDQTGGAGGRLGMGVLGIANSNRFPTADSDSMTRGAAIVGYAKLFGTSKKPGATGYVQMVHGDDNLAAITVSLAGLAPNTQYAIHVHDFGDMTNADGTSAGGHYNPFGWTHACFPATGRRHVGDIGNLPNTTGSGDLTVTLFRDWISMTGENSTIGRAIIVHQWTDDCQTQPTGNAGSRYLHGVLGSAAGFTNGSSSNPGPKTPLKGLMAQISATSDAAAANSAPTGTVYITTDPLDAGTTVVYVNIAGVAANTTHGFHVHVWGDWSLSNGNGAGGHYNPQGYPHALPTQANNRHAGDLGNVMADGNGNIVTTIRVINLPIQTIAGRAVVLHALVDQGSAQQPSGAAGARIALGVLGILNPATVIPVPGTANTTDSSSTGTGCPPDQICAGAMATPSVAALIAGALLLAVIRRD